jgi:FimV-like protein
VVQAGQTASAISIQIRPPNTNLNQVLVALKDKNPSAFIKGNVNRLRAGVSLSLPNEEEVREITAQQAMLIITKDNQSFEQIRQADRKNTLTEASGTKPADNTSKRDKLTLSRANRAQPSSTHTPSPTAADEAQADLIAQSKQDQEQRNRLAELQKTAQDLQSIKRDASPSESASPNAPPAATQITAAPAPEQATSTNSNRSIWIWAGIVTLVVGLGYTASRWLTGNKFREHAKPNDNPLERVQQLIQEGRDREAGEYLKAQLSSNPALMVTLSTLLDLYTPKRSS